MTITKFTNHHSFVRECKEANVTLDLLIEAQLCVGKQGCSKLFIGKCKRGGGSVVSSALIENWVFTLQYARDHPDEKDDDPFQRPREVRPNEEWEKFVALVKQPIQKDVIESWKTMSKPKLGEEAKKYGITMGVANSKALQNIHERMFQMVERRSQLFWNQPELQEETNENQPINYKMCNIFQLREIAKSKGVSALHKKKEEVIRLIEEADSIKEDALVVYDELSDMAYADMSLQKLKQVARDKGLLDYCNLQRNELIEALILHDEREQQQKDRITLGGFEIVARKTDGYINATILCQAGGKEFSNWHKNSKTIDFLTELASDLRIRRSELTNVIQGDNSVVSQGTWVHPQVAINIAQWVSPKFAVLVTKWITTLLSTGFVQIERPVRAISTLTEIDVEAEKLEYDVDVGKFSTVPVIYTAYIGRSMVKVGFSDGKLIQRDQKHMSSESQFPQWRIIHLVRVSGRPMEKILHDYLIPHKASFHKQKEIYQPRQGLRRFVERIQSYLECNDLVLKVEHLERENAELRLKLASLNQMI